jgi:hypothetical protein
MTDVMEAIGAELSGQPAPEPVEAPAEAPAPVETPPVETPAPVEAPQPEPRAEPGHVPINALMDERDKRKAAQAEAEQLRREIAQRNAQPTPIPSVMDDPEGFQNYVQAQVRQAEWNSRVELSHRFAATAHADVLEPAKEWFEQEAQKNPLLAAEFQRSPDPFDLVVTKYRQSQALSHLGGKSFEEAAQAWAIQQGYVATGAPSAPATAQASTPAAQPAPTRSLAALASAGGPDTVPTGKLAAFDSVFPSPG